MNWKELSMKDRASYIKLGIDNGITDLDTIKEVYNKYKDGGGLRDKALNRANYVASNYDKAQDFDMNPFVYTIRKALKDWFDKGGLSNCTLSATQWVDPNNSYMSAKNIEGHSNTGYKEISKDAAVPGDLLISKNPNRGSYHTMMITGFDKNQNPILSYSRGGHDTKNNLVTGRGLLDYHAADNSQGGYHTEDHYFRYSYPDETTLPEVVITAPRKKEFKIGGPLKKSYEDFSTRLSKAWNNQDLSKDDYNYQKYYNDNPEKAYRQLEAIERGSKAHFPDEGKSGTYKTPNHPTYPDLGINSWLDNDRVFNMSQRQAHGDTDRVLDYLGSDIDYNNGSTRAMYNGAYQLPSITVTPKGNHTDLIPNELGTGWMYKSRAGRYNDFDYNYVNNYPSNKKSLGGNLFKDGGGEGKGTPSKIKIKYGDTLSGLAKKYNSSVEELAKLNSIKDVDKIYAGDSLILPSSDIPPSSPQSTPSDTLQDSIPSPSISERVDRETTSRRGDLKYSKDTIFGESNDTLLGIDSTNIDKIFNTYPHKNINIDKVRETVSKGERLQGVLHNGEVSAVGYGSLPTAEVTTLSKKSLYNLASRARNEKDGKAIAELNTYLATKGNQIPNTWKKELGIDDSYISHLQNYYTSEELRNSETGKYYFNADADTLRQMVDLDKYMSSKAIPFALRTAAAGLSGGASELIIPIALATANLGKKAYNHVAPDSIKANGPVLETARGLWNNSNASSVFNVDNPYLASTLNFAQSFAGGIPKGLSAIQLGTGAASQVGTTGLQELNNSEYKAWWNSPYAQGVVSSLGLLGPGKGNIGNTFGNVIRQGQQVATNLASTEAAAAAYGAGLISEQDYGDLLTAFPIAGYKLKNGLNYLKETAKSTGGKSTMTFKDIAGNIVYDRVPTFLKNMSPKSIKTRVQNVYDALAGKEYQNDALPSSGYTLVDTPSSGVLALNRNNEITSNNYRSGRVANYDNEGNLNTERAKGRTSIDLMFDDLSGIEPGDKTAYGEISKIVDVNDSAMPPGYTSYFKGKKGKVVFNELDSQTGARLSNGNILYWDTKIPENSKLIGDVSISKSDKLWNVGKDSEGNNINLNYGGAHLLIYQDAQGNRYCKMSDITAAHVKQPHYDNLTTKAISDIYKNNGFSSNIQDDIAKVKNMPNLKVGTTVTLGNEKSKFTYTITENDINSKTGTLKNDSPFKTAFTEHRHKLVENEKRSNRNRKDFYSDLAESLQNNIVNETQGMPLDKFVDNLSKMKNISKEEAQNILNIKNK